MQEIPDHALEASIARNLRFDTLVTSRQHQQARERLLLRAAAQTMLPPVPVLVEEPPTLLDHAHTLRHHTLRFLHLLLLDSSIYERARKPPRLHEFYNAHGRYAYSVIHLSA